MSGTGPASGETQTKARVRPRREQARTAALVLLAAVVAVFAVLNVESVEVNWILGSGHAPLIIVIVVSLLVGVVLRHFAGLRSARKR